MSLRIRDVMTEDVMTVHMDDTLLTVRAIFNDLGFHHLLVTEDRKLLGVLSDRDLLRWLSPNLDTAAETMSDVNTLRKPVHQIMTRRPITVTPETTVTYAGNFLLEKKVSCLPVVNDRDRPIGIVSWRDLLSAFVMLQNV